MLILKLKEIKCTNIFKIKKRFAKVSTEKEKCEMWRLTEITNNFSKTNSKKM